jgi:hypothetical protein
MSRKYHFEPTAVFPTISRTLRKQIKTTNKTKTERGEREKGIKQYKIYNMQQSKK